jgi:hypothetical protein
MVTGDYDRHWPSDPLRMDFSVAHGAHALRPGSRQVTDGAAVDDALPSPAARQRLSGRLAVRLLLLLAMVCAIVIGAFYLDGVTPVPVHDVLPVAELHPPGAATSVLTGTPVTEAISVARQLYASAPVVIVARATAGAALTAARDSQRDAAPVLLIAGSRHRGAARILADVRAEIGALQPRYVLAVGPGGTAIAAQLPGQRVVRSPRALPVMGAATPLRRVALLVPARRGDVGAIAAAATARSAGVRVLAVRGGDPRADPAAIRVLAAARPLHVLAIGAGFGAAGVLAAKIAVAETGVQLPGGGQVLFPMHRIVALYGHPGVAALGALGQQSLAAGIARIRAIAAEYQPLSSVPVIPAIEIIATVAEGSAGQDGLYSYQTPTARMRHWVRRATAAGLYVVLDLQPGRASLLTQAKRYQALLRLPDVGLAVDPEWQLQPSEVPLHQIGTVSAADVNGVISWLAALTARYRLPQKLLVVHQFRLSMISDESSLDTRYPDLAVVIHMDGQGTPADKFQTWAAVTKAAPRGVFFGWKNFFVKDDPMLTPAQTMVQRPQPVMISYQ